MPACAHRRHLLAAAAGLVLLPRGAWAQLRDGLRIVCAYPPGGSLDIVSRKLAEKITARTRQPAIVDNKPGAAGRLGVLEIRRAPADGRHLLVTPASVLTMYPHVYPQLGYDVFHDVQPVCTVAATAFALAIGPKVPAAVTNVREFVQWCGANRGAAQCGNAGAGSMPHFMAMLLAREAGIELDHVPYRGGLAAMQSTAAGDVAAALATESAARGLHQAGKLRVLATSGTQRTSSFPQVPTFGEQGWTALVQREWFGVFAPAGTPPAAIGSLSEVLLASVGDADVRDTWERAGLQVDGLSATQLAESLRREHDFWEPLIRSSGFKPES